MPRWVYAMTQHDLPEGFKATMELEGKEIVEVVLANVGGTICAFENPCPHDGGALGEGELLGEEIVCPLHGGRFNVRTGTSPLIRAFRSGRSPSASSMRKFMSSAEGRLPHPFHPHPDPPLKGKQLG